MIKLIGILIVVIGFLWKKDTIATVVVAGIATGLVTKMSVLEILNVLGSTFVAQRLMTIFVLTLPVIGICERYGLKDKAVDLIKKAKNITAGRLLSIYLLGREFAAAAAIRISGHPQFVRPLINPMAQGAAIALYGDLDEDTEEDIKASCAAVENYGNFFAQNVFLGSSGTLLIVGTLKDYGMIVDPLSVAMASIPVAILAFAFSFVQNYFFDKKIKQRNNKKKEVA